MQMLLIHVKGLAQPLGLRFRDRESAVRQWDEIARHLESPPSMGIGASDDFAQKVAVARHSDVIAISLLDVEQDLEAQGVTALLQARKNAEPQRQAQAEQSKGLLLASEAMPGMLRRPN